MNAKLPLLAVISGAVLALVALLGATDTARADFNPSYEISIVEPRGGASSDWLLDFSLPEGDVQFGAAVFFIPGEWGITSGDDIPIGAVSGTLTAAATLGIINGPCNNVLPVEFTMLNASIDVTDTVSYLDAEPEADEEGYDPNNPGNGEPDYSEDKDGSGLQDGFEKYPDFITRTIVDEDDQPQQPIRRVAGITIVAGVKVLLQFLVFEPGTFIDEQIPNDVELGYPSVTLLQNAGDPDADPIPGAITDFCTPLLTKITNFGITRDNTCTDTSAERLDPLCEVSSVVLLECDDGDDNDGDQTANDGCPTVGDGAETACDDDVDDDSDGRVNDGCPAVEEPENSTPTEPDESGVAISTNPAEGTYTFTVIAAGQRDADGDGYENSMDTCAFDVNEGDPRIKGDGDLDEDGLDAICDPNDNEINSDNDLPEGDGYTNRQDNCPLIANGELEEDVPNAGNQRDSDDDSIGDACDPNPDDPDTEGELVFGTVSPEVSIGPGAAPSDGATPAVDSDDDGGGGAAIIIVIAVIAAVVVLGGGAFFFMRRRGT